MTIVIGDPVSYAVDSLGVGTNPESLMAIDEQSMGANGRAVEARDDIADKFTVDKLPDSRLGTDAIQANPNRLGRPGAMAMTPSPAWSADCSSMK